ncbi:conserved hypothetical protein [Methanolacinia petrolearia DSM 11571]|uniref:Uncharacterized protein n=1 Tax=Methanolacinia petrolearia (strain DSM 11571 / OCM 486 / SEBR 4847) TaxID=679926 RepID=E1RFX5_METP4|nr:hypothetical protein [Methanolacinia petrolearia]ADN35127.1 conserved hypothetical protein [Methanolacinia petrolearia DSM 11571]
MTNKDIPCCAADAMRRVKQIDVEGTVVGITMLEEIIAEVRQTDLRSKTEITETLLKKVRIYNYIPDAAETKYKIALFKEYENRK